MAVPVDVILSDPPRRFGPTDRLRPLVIAVEGSAFSGSRLAILWRGCVARYQASDAQEDRALALAYQSAPDPATRALIVQAQRFNAAKDAEVEQGNGLFAQMHAVFRTIAGAVEEICTAASQRRGAGQP